jgi:tetratricopeptide (TPR) repeat protein
MENLENQFNVVYNKVSSDDEICEVIYNIAHYHSIKLLSLEKAQQMVESLLVTIVKRYENENAPFELAQAFYSAGYFYNNQTPPNIEKSREYFGFSRLLFWNYDILDDWNDYLSATSSLAQMLYQEQDYEGSIELKKEIISRIEWQQDYNDDYSEDFHGFYEDLVETYHMNNEFDKAHTFSTECMGKMFNKPEPPNLENKVFFTGLYAETLRMTGKLIESKKQFQIVQNFLNQIQLENPNKNMDFTFKMNNKVLEILDLEIIKQQEGNPMYGWRNNEETEQKIA